MPPAVQKADPDLILAQGSSGKVVNIERRKRDRLQLSLMMYLVRKGDPDHPYQASIADISSSGFFCTLPFAPFQPGEILECFILLPHGSTKETQTHCLTCRAKVVRLRRLETSQCGVGCEIEEYTLRTCGKGRQEKDPACPAKALCKYGLPEDAADEKP
jgi:hypothetical protein